MKNRHFFIHLLKIIIISTLFSTTQVILAESLPIVKNVNIQPLKAQINRLIEAKVLLGEPFTEVTKTKIDQAIAQNDEDNAILQIQQILDNQCLIDIQINPESRVKVKAGIAKPVLIEKGWRNFLVKVRNEAGVTAPLELTSINALPLAGSPKNELKNRWLDLDVFNSQPLTESLSGLELEYRIIQLYSRDKGKRDAKLSFNVGQGTQDLGFRNEVSLLFDCLPAYTIKLNVLDENNKPTTAGFEIRDHLGRVYPSQAKRLAPDFHFHPQIYRAHSETVKLPAGTYQIKFYRGPESITETRSVNIKASKTESFKVKRWIDPSLMGWWSGDHHIHAAGCAHYTNPTEGVHAPDMMRHCLGEDLKVGANLTWGPCFDYQKQFFTGKDDRVSQFPYILRYDIEVSGFGSHQSGHLCLLRLRQQMFPGGNSKDHWPKLCLNTLKWAKRQGAIVGPAHTGWGLTQTSSDLPTYEVPPFNSIGANEFIADVTHKVLGPNGKLVPAVDFLSMVDTPYVWELNIWYHILNCGFRTRVSGETDFPCIYGERVGLGRSYVKLDNKLNYNDWCEGIRLGRNYVGDGRSHIIDFQVDHVEMGTKNSELQISKPGTVLTKAKVAALLNTQPIPGIAKRNYAEKPYWHIERARIENTRKVPVEVIVNGYPIAKKEIIANGELQDIAFEVPIQFSSWIALRILPSSHTNPVFVIVDKKPIRASRRSAQWCLSGVKKCRKEKLRFMGEDEIDDFNKTYDHAEMVYKKIISESVAN